MSAHYVATLPPGTQAEIIGVSSPNFGKLNGECCSIIGPQAGQNPGSTMVVLSSGQCVALPTENLQVVDMLAGDAVVIVDAYQQLDPKYRLQRGMLIQVDHSAVVVQVKMGSVVEHLSVPISNVVMINPMALSGSPVAAGAASGSPYDFPGISSQRKSSPDRGNSRSTPPARQASPKSRIKWAPDVEVPASPASKFPVKAPNRRDGTLSISSVTSSEGDSAWLEQCEDGSGTNVNVVCLNRRGLVFDLVTKLNDAGVDVYEVKREEVDHKVALIIKVADDNGGPVAPSNQKSLQEAVLECAERSNKTPSRYQKMRKMVRRAKSSEFNSISDNVNARREFRSHHRLMIIGPGFGNDLNQQQYAMVAQAGYELRHVMCADPDRWGFRIQTQLGELQHAINEFQPDCILVASKAGVYMQALWDNNLWTGPSLVINAHPALKIPLDVPVVLCHGSNDQVFPRPRMEVEFLFLTSTKNMCFLYYTANSGVHSSGGYTRMGDEHVMESLLTHDCLPRLIDAAISKNPEVNFMKSWKLQLQQDWAKASKWLGLSPDELKERWTEPPADQVYGGVPVVDVEPNSEEYHMVAALFRSTPLEEPNHKYPDNPRTGRWDRTPILRIQRVQNSAQLDGGFAPYYEQIKIAIGQVQGMEFQKGIHTRWVFHGTAAIEDIALNPIAGFLPLASGARGGTLWGAGTYFARDAKYVARAGFAVNMPNAQTRRMFLCLLITGVPCLGDPDNKGILPLRQDQCHYNSCVDSLNNPEIWVAQLSRAAYPAYVITFS